MLGMLFDFALVFKEAVIQEHLCASLEVFHLGLLPSDSSAAVCTASIAKPIRNQHQGQGLSASLKTLSFWRYLLLTPQLCTGYPYDDVYIKTEINSLITTIDINNYYTETEVDDIDNELSASNSSDWQQLGGSRGTRVGKGVADITGSAVFKASGHLQCLSSPPPASPSIHASTVYHSIIIRKNSDANTCNHHNARLIHL